MTGDATTEFDLIQTDGTPQQGEIERVSEHDWFQFNAAAGTTYAMEVQLGTLRDSTISLIDTDRETIILENDDSESMASFIEWTCPATGSYYILVRGYGRESGTFQVMVADTSRPGYTGLAGGSSGDPCNGGGTMTGQGSLSFQPDGNYQDSRACDWQVSCAAGQTASFTFTELDTELDLSLIHI